MHGQNYIKFLCEEFTLFASNEGQYSKRNC